jgi:cob(I)alamin adenosyltransferase
MKIYTKTGDQGETSLIGGERVMKTHDRIEAYGTIDELNSWLGLIADQDIHKTHKTRLFQIQESLFVIGSHLACIDSKKADFLPQLHDNDIAMLEQAIDAIQEQLPQLHGFILPGGNTVSSYCQIARTVCRRAERDILKIDEYQQSNTLLQFINRLSDYLFVLARVLLVDANIEARIWNATKK